MEQCQHSIDECQSKIMGGGLAQDDYRYYAGFAKGVYASFKALDETLRGLFRDDTFDC